MIHLLDYRKNKKQLLTPGKKITQEDLDLPEFQTNLENMRKILTEDGVGLAATQVNWSVTLFMLNIDEVEPEPNVLESADIFINPRIVSFSKKKIKMPEACLSFPGLDFIKIERPETVTWEYETLDWETKQKTNSGLYARAVQHEIDHLHGKVFIQLASSASKLKINRWLRT